ncbi:MAG TPA: S8 family serine peptidase [Pyrinomonadaceae bacterium]|nr:S8 family serine peptidase [Pyrinomonadaceae bacterium]
MLWRKIVSLLLLVSTIGMNVAHAGVTVVKSNGITLTGADGITLTGADGITLTGADSFLSYQSNGITLTGADGITLTGADGITLTGADGSTYTGTNGITLTGADGITLTGADGITLTGADGITLTGADGTNHRADSIVIRQPNGITLTGADGITLTGADGITRVGENGITLTGADGITLTGADGITLTGADGVVCFRADGSTFTVSPNGITLTGADGITLTGADGITLTGADGITLTGADNEPRITTGLQSVDPELAIRLNQIADDSNVNAIVVFHRYPTDADLLQLNQIGIVGGTRFRMLPMIVVTAQRQQLVALSRLSNVRSIYGNRTLSFNADPYFNVTGLRRVAPDRDLQQRNLGMPVSGRNVTVAVLDTGINSQHNDLAGRIVQNVKLTDTQSAGIGFIYPAPVENVLNSDLTSGHGTFVAGIVAASGVSSGGKYNGVAPGAKILGLSAGDLNLTHVLSGFDYLLERGATYNARVVNCSFSANTVFDFNDPVNIATKMVTQRGINVVFSAGNAGSGNGTLNPYAAAPWVVSVGATDNHGKLANFSSRGVFGSRQFSPTLVAPGDNVVSLRSSNTQTGVLGVAGADSSRLTPAEIPFYTTARGTSFSAPQVAGAIALMLEVNPNLTPAEVKDILRRSATPLPPFYHHEVGAGMLNVHAAVVEAAFPNRKTGLFRAVMERKGIRFLTAPTQNFSGIAVPGSPVAEEVNFPADAIQGSVHIAWGNMTSPNDLSLKLYDANNTLQGNSNYLNAPGLTGRREKVTVNNLTPETWRAVIGHTLGLGTAQSYVGTVEATTIQYAPFADLQMMSPGAQAVIKESLRNYLMLPDGNRFRPAATVTRADFAAALLRGGRIPQFVAANPMFSDVRDISTRGVVESVQSNPTGKLFFDTAANGNFSPYAPTTKLVAAVALVKAAGLENLTASTPLNVSDADSIPSAFRGYVAVALAKGLLARDADNFAPSRPISRAELAQAMVRLTRIAVE